MINTTKKLLLLPLIAITLSACGGDGSTAGTADTSSDNGYTAEDSQAAIDQCIQSGASKAMCECATKEIQAQFSAAEMKQLEADMAAGKTISDEFARASAQAGIKCMQLEN